MGLESTIVDLTGSEPMILRPGYITKKMLEDVFGHVSVDQTILKGDTAGRPKAPGMKYRHYAPRGNFLSWKARRMQWCGGSTNCARRLPPAESVRE